MDVDPGWNGWISFSGDQPRRPVVSVAVALRVDWNNIHEDVEQQSMIRGVIEIGGVDGKTGKTDADCGKHPPGKKINASMPFQQYMMGKRHALVQLGLMMENG